MYRLFLAIDPPEEIQRDLGRLCFGLPGASWVAQEQLHLTLRFIGLVDGVRCRAIDDAMAALAFHPFSLTIQGTGVFPPRGRPTVLWAGIAVCAELRILQQKVEIALQKAGVPAEARKFHPHITLARLKNAPAARVARFLSGNSLFSLPRFQVTMFSLYSSHLTAKHAIHTRECSYHLK